MSKKTINFFKFIGAGEIFLKITVKENQFIYMCADYFIIIIKILILILSNELVSFYLSILLK